MTPNLPQEKEEKPNGTTSRGSLFPFYTHRDRRRKLPTTAFQRGGRATYTLPPKKEEEGKKGLPPF